MDKTWVKKTYKPLFSARAKINSYSRNHKNRITTEKKYIEIWFWMTWQSYRESDLFQFSRMIWFIKERVPKNSVVSFLKLPRRRKWTWILIVYKSYEKKYKWNEPGSGKKLREDYKMICWERRESNLEDPLQTLFPSNRLLPKSSPLNICTILSLLEFA